MLLSLWKTWDAVRIQRPFPIGELLGKDGTYGIS